MILCFYCGSTFENHSFTAREMMFGTRERFEYAQCPNCKSCILITPLDSFDLLSHYPHNYYSFSKEIIQNSNLKSFLIERRGEYLFGQKNIIGLITHLFKPASHLLKLKSYGINIENTILDVGTGSGAFLSMLRKNGFRKLSGCDPFIEKSISKPDIEIKKCSIEEMTGSYDFIFFNHSFEHLINPPKSLASARHLQHSGGTCIIRIPTTSSLAFERYGTNWVQLDPPRHISIPSREGMRELATSVGYRLEDMIDDSDAFQFWGSEQYIKDIPLTADNSYGENPKRSIFSQSDIDRFEREAKEANKLKRGDQTAFVLRAI
jgi:SAM-dependent methyltransferase